MSSNSEFVMEWNEIFTFKIKESDLERPTEKFLFSALINYLQKFNIDVAPLINMNANEDSEKRRLFKLQFCKYIDHYYKISDKANAFYYYDLINPSPRKTAHMLKYLLNYLVYYNVTKEEILSKAEQKIQQRDNILGNLRKIQKENDAIELKAKKINEKVEEYSSLIPTLNGKLEKLEMLQATQQEKLTHLRDASKRFDSLLLELKSKEADLRCLIVSQDAVDDLFSKKASLEKEIADVDENERNIIACNQEIAKQIDKLQSIKRIEALMEMYPVEYQLSHKKLKLLLNDLKRKHAVQISLNEKKTEEIEIKLKKLKELKEIHNQKKTELNSIRVHAEKILTELNAQIESQETEKRKAADKLKRLEDDIIVENENCEFIIESTQELMTKIRLDCQ